MCKGQEVERSWGGGQCHGSWEGRERKGDEARAARRAQGGTPGTRQVLMGHCRAHPTIHEDHHKLGSRLSQ